MSEEGECKSCGQCGREMAVAELMVDEDTGQLLCPFCSREHESCGCRDEEE